MAVLRNHEDTEAWYKQFWPWFIIALPATAVIASSHLVYTAINNKPEMVLTNYYKEGMAINEEISTEKLADTLDINADLIVIDNTIEVRLRGRLAKPPANITLVFQHPIEVARDMTVVAVRGADDVYRTTTAIAPFRWYVSIEGIDQDSMAMWLIKGEIDLSHENSATLLDRSL
jgi:hypothetical protein